MNSPKAIIFDCFGVLYNNALSSFYKEHLSFFHNHTKELDDLNLHVNLGEISRAEAYEAFERMDGSIHVADIRAEVDRRLTLDTKLIALIKKLKSYYKIGLLSNAGEDEIAIIYKDKIDDLFDTIAVSYEIGRVKPVPTPYLACAERLQVPPQDCVLVDDSKINLEGAEKVGMSVIYYPEFGIIPEGLAMLLERRSNDHGVI